MSNSGKWLRWEKGWGVVDIRYYNPELFLEELEEFDKESVRICWEELDWAWKTDYRDIDELIAIWRLLNLVKERYGLPLGAMEPPGKFGRL